MFNTFFFLHISRMWQLWGKFPKPNMESKKQIFWMYNLEIMIQHMWEWRKNLCDSDDKKNPSVWLRNGPVSQRCDCICIRLQSRRGIKFIYRIHQESPRGILRQVLKLLPAVGFRWRPNTNSHEACALCRVVVWFARMGRGEALLGCWSERRTRNVQQSVLSSWSTWLQNRFKCILQ